MEVNGMIREEELQDIESRSEAEITLSIPYNIFAEYCLELTAEVRRLKSDLESWQDIAHDRLKNWCMFTEKSGELEQEVRRLKNLFIKQQLKGETNESK
jgi:hypothetical protein